MAGAKAHHVKAGSLSHDLLFFSIFFRVGGGVFCFRGQGHGNGQL
jgi:hypothetical protein